MFQLDVEINSWICHLKYKHSANADVVDNIGAAGVDKTVLAVKTNGLSPIGPAPVS